MNTTEKKLFLLSTIGLLLKNNKDSLNKINIEEVTINDVIFSVENEDLDIDFTNGQCFRLKIERVN